MEILAWEWLTFWVWALRAGDVYAGLGAVASARAWGGACAAGAQPGMGLVSMAHCAEDLACWALSRNAVRCRAGFVRGVCALDLVDKLPCSMSLGGGGLFAGLATQGAPSSEGIRLLCPRPR